jgi:hypothetical protein
VVTSLTPASSVTERKKGWSAAFSGFVRADADIWFRLQRHADPP